MDPNVISALIASVSTLIVGFGTIFLDKFLTKRYETINAKKSKNLSKQEIEHIEYIQSYLDNLRKDVNADRAVIYEFHNGGNYYFKNRSIKKYSISFESVSNGIEKILEKYQNIPTATFTYVLGKLEKNKEYTVKDTEKSLDPTIFSFGTLHGIKSIAFLPLISISGSFVGFVGFHYFDEQTDLKLLTQNINDKLQLMVGYVENHTDF